MCSVPLNSAWKNKMELIDIFDEKFLNEKNIALQPISFNLDIDNNNTTTNNNNLTTDNNSTTSNKIELKESQNSKKKKNKNDEKADSLPKSQKSPKSPKSKQRKKELKKPSLSNSELYSSNIVIVQSLGDGASNCSSVDPIEKEVEKIKKMMTRSRSKKYKRKNSKSKGLKTPNSAK